MIFPYENTDGGAVFRECPVSQLFFEREHVLPVMASFFATGVMPSAGGTDDQDSLDLGACMAIGPYRSPW